MMDKNSVVYPPHRNYADMYEEIDNVSDPQVLQEVVFKLLKENEKLSRDCHRKYKELDQISSLTQTLSEVYEKKKFEIDSMKKLLAISVNTRDKFLRDYIKNFESHFDDEAKRIFFSLTPPLHGFLSQCLESAACNLLISRAFTMSMHKSFTRDDREVSEKPEVIEFLDSIDKAIAMMLNTIPEVKQKLGVPYGPAKGAKRSRKRKISPLKNRWKKKGKIQKGNETCISRDLSTQNYGPADGATSSRKRKSSPLENRRKKKGKIQKENENSGDEKKVMKNVRVEKGIQVDYKMHVRASKSVPRKIHAQEGKGMKRKVLEENEDSVWQIPAHKNIKSAKIRYWVVALTDVLKDPAAESDPLVAQYKQKQATFLKDNDVAASGKEEDTVSNDHNKDNIPEHKSPSEENDEPSNPGSHVDCQDEDNDETEPQGPISDYSELNKSPRTTPILIDLSTSTSDQADSQCEDNDELSNSGSDADSECEDNDEPSNPGSHADSQCEDNDEPSNPGSHADCQDEDNDETRPQGSSKSDHANSHDEDNDETEPQGPISDYSELNESPRTTPILIDLSSSTSDQADSQCEDNDEPSNPRSHADSQDEDNDDTEPQGSMTDYSKFDKSPPILIDLT